MFKAGTLLLNMYRTSNYPKDKILFSPNNTVEEQPATSAPGYMTTTVTSFISHEAIEARGGGGLEHKKGGDARREF